MKNTPRFYRNIDLCVDDIIQKIGNRIVLALPLGLGKANSLANVFFQRAVANPDFHLKIVTAITLEKPVWKNDLERRLVAPLSERLFNGYPDLDYALALRNNRLPPNVEVVEFFHRTAAYLKNAHARQNYISTSYTLVARDMAEQDVNVIAQIIRPGEKDGSACYSLGCNPDVSLDGVRILREQEKAGKPVAVIGQVNPDLPFMYGDAVVKPDFFDAIVDSPDDYFPLFAAPRAPVGSADHMIGIHTSALIRDGGTLQIGIGSLGDAVTWALHQRHLSNPLYNRFIETTGIREKFGKIIEKTGDTGPFDQGLYGCTEMLVDGYLHLMRNGILRRKVYEDVSLQRLLNAGEISETVTPEMLDRLVSCGAICPQLSAEDVMYLQKFGIIRDEWHLEEGFLSDGKERIPANWKDTETRKSLIRCCPGKQLRGGVLVHGGFFIGPQDFYDALERMSEAEREQIHMTSILKVNQLYSCPYASQELKTLQRRKARFANAALMVTLSGAVISDGLEDGQIISGVGGQYNFVSMAHALPDARSIIMLRSTRTERRRVHSNILWNYGHTTIPRYLRDIVVTEYGIADLRARSDREIIAALLNITDSRFQEELLRKAKKAGKIPADYRIPDRFRNNFPERISSDMKPFREQGMFPEFPFGTDITPEEQVLAKALRRLKSDMAARPVPAVNFRALCRTLNIPDAARPFLERMQLDRPSGLKEILMQRIVVYALASGGYIQT